MRALEQGGGVTPLSDATRLQRLLDAGTLTVDRLTDKGRAVLLNQAIESGKLTFDKLTPKGHNLLATYNQPSIAPQMGDWWKGVQLAQSFRTTPPGPSAAQEVGRGLIAGTGDVVGNIGATAQWLGALRPPTEPTEEEKKVMLAQSFRKTEPAPMPTQEGVPWEGWKTLLNPHYYTRNVARAVPFSAALIIPGLAVGAGVSSLLGLGAFGATVLGTVVGGVAGGTLNRALESAMEAGGTYEEALAKGKSEEEADRAADVTFKKNMRLAGLDILELVTTFTPGLKATSRIGKAALAAGRLAAAGGEEALEEGLQEKYQREALGEPFSWKAPQTQEAMAMGGLMGAGLGAVGEGGRMISDIQQRAVGKLSGPQRAKFNQEVATRVQQGKTWDVAAREALDALAGEPTVKAAIEEATKEAVARYAEAQPDQRTFQEQAGTTIQGLPTEKEVRNLGADYRDALVELQPGDKVQLPNDATTYTVTATPARVWQATIRDDTGRARTVSKDDIIADYATLKDRLTRRLAEEEAKKNVRPPSAQMPKLKTPRKKAIPAKVPVVGEKAQVAATVAVPGVQPPVQAPQIWTPPQAVGAAAVLPSQVWTPPAKATPTGKARAAVPLHVPDLTSLTPAQAVSQVVQRGAAPSTQARLTTRPVQPTSQPTPSPAPSAGQIAAPGVATAPVTQVAIKVGDTVYSDEAKPYTVVDVSDRAMLTLKNERGTQLKMGRAAVSLQPPAVTMQDILKQTVKRMTEENVPRQVEKKFGPPGVIETQLKGAREIIDAIRGRNDVKLSDAEVERVVTATRGPMTWTGQIVEKMGDLGDGFKDVFQYEWTVKNFPRFQDQIRRFQGVARDAQVWSLETYLNIVSHLENPKEFRIFRKMIVLNDLLVDLRAGKVVPGKLSVEQVLTAIDELRPNVNENIKQALAAHDEVFKAAWKELQRRGKVEEKAEPKEAYYPHRVMDYLSDNDFPALGRRLKEPYRYYLKKRGGTARLIDTDYLTVTMEHLAKVYMDNATDDFALEIARDWDVWRKIAPEQREKLGKLEAGKLYDIDGKEYLGWQYLTSRFRNPAIMDVMQAAMQEQDLARLEKLRLAYGDIHVIPREMADRITRLREPRISSRMLALARGAGWMWKNIVLGPFGVGIPWQFSNFIGDTMNLYREAAEDVTKVPAGWKMAGQWQRGEVSERFKHAVDVAEQARVAEAGFIRSGGIPYDPMLAKLDPQRYFLRKFNIFQQWRTLSERRELSTRFAKLLGDLERIERGEAPKVKMFDVKKLQEAGMTPVEIAGKAAREFTVDYGKLTPEQKQVLRDVFFPFSTFYMGNFANWVSYIKGHPGEALLKFGVPLAALAAYNAFAHPDDEEKLPLYYRVIPHLITGYETPDGKPIIIGFQTPLDMAAKVIGLEIVGDLARQVQSGDKSIEDAAKELAGNMALGIPRQMWNLLHPLFKAPIEAAMNLNTFTGAPIVSEDIKDTPEGKRARLNYVVQQWLAPYGQYMRAARDIEPEKALSKWLLQGPADIKRAFGIREVDTDRETVSRFYDELDKLTGAYNVWKDKRDKGEQPKAFTDLAKLRRLEAVARDFTDQWKVVARIKADKTRTQEQKDKEVRDRYVNMARRSESVLNPGK